MTSAEMTAALERFDDSFRVAAPMSPASKIPNGFYTVTLPDGTHRTFRLRTKKLTSRFAPGQRVLGLLVGPDNEKDYDDFSFLDNNGPRVWARFRGGEHERLARLLWRLATGEEIGGHQVMVSKRCLVCNRTLTTDESLVRGIGPNCWERMQHG